MSEQEQTTATEQPAAPGLTLADLTIALQTIQVVAQRGAIKAEEMATVGGLYDRLFAFLKAQGVVGQDAAPAADVPPQGN
jgi:hypothetical protein